VHELLPRQAPEPAGGPEEDALPRLRLGLGLPSRLVVCAVAGLALSLAFPPAGLWPIAFFAPVPLFAIAPSRGPLRGALLGFAFGFAFFGATLSWIGLFGELAWAALTSLCALFVAAFGALAPFVAHPGRPIVTSAGVAALWTGIDWVRGVWPLGGFTWGQLGVSQVDNPVTLRAASLGGVWLVTFIVAWAAALLAAALARPAAPARAQGCRVAIALAVTLAPILLAWPTASGPPVDVAATVVDVRPHRTLPPREEDRAVAGDILALHARVVANDPPDLVVWGESALDPGAAEPGYFRTVSERIAAGGVPVVAGSIQPGPRPGQLKNAVLAIDGSGDVTTRYTKTHLVPFGEYVPFAGLLRGRISALEQIAYDLTPGERLSLQRLPGLPAFATPVCFENSFPAIERGLVRRGARFIVVVTNNASYELTAASAQHLQMSRLRAVETGRWVVHAAISGISAVVDPTGRVLGSRGLFDPGSVRATIEASSAITPYVRFGDIVPVGAGALALALFLMPRSRSARRARPTPLGRAPRTLVIVPTFEERATIERVVRGALAAGPHVEVLVVDDASPDGTAEVVRRVAASEPRVRLAERPGRRGLRSAYLQGFGLALDHGYELVVEMDADLSHDPAELPELLEAAASGADLAIGSRYVPGGSVSNWSAARVALSRAGNLYARLALGFPIRDSTSGYRVYRRDLLREITARPLRSDGYGFQIELALRAYRGGWTIVERPITFREREHGRSKLSRRIVLEALWLVARWGIRLRAGNEA
jgi:apolipoprotein N-acyltransferase